jgi:hypothetical protein
MEFERHGEYVTRFKQSFGTPAGSTLPQPPFDRSAAGSKQMMLIEIKAKHAPFFMMPDIGDSNTSSVIVEIAEKLKIDPAELSRATKRTVL